MELVKLGEVAEILNGFAFKSDAFINQGTKVIRIGDINDNKVYKDNCVCIDEKTYSFPDLCRVKKDDVLMALSGATTGKIGIIDEELEGALVNQRIAIIRSQNQTTQKYIQYIFRGELLQKLLINAWGAAQPNLSSNALRSLEIPLPPIASQRRIANILDKADEIIRKRKEAIALTEQLQKSIFLDMFGDPVTNPKGWEVKRLEDVTTKITDGTHKTPQYVQEGILFLSAKNIKKHKIDWDNIKFISPDEHNKLIKRCNPEMGDILLTKSGSIGDAVLIDKHLEFSLFESVALIKLNKKVINPLFLSFLLNQSSVGFFYKRNTKGITIKHLHLVDIKRIPIIVPAQQKQNEFCFKVQKIKDQENLLLKFLQESENLFNSLLQKAFKGEL